MPTRGIPSINSLSLGADSGSHPVVHVNEQALAESMGIDTDWNCAISLRPLQDSSQPDPHRMKSDYADWDVKVTLEVTLEYARIGCDASVAFPFFSPKLTLSTG